MRTPLQRRRTSTTSEEALPRAELDALHETALLVAERHEMPELLPLILARAAELVGASGGYLYLFQPDRESLAIVAGRGEFARRIGSR